MTAAELKEHGWGVGDVLADTRMTLWQVTGIGLKAILVRKACHVAGYVWWDSEQPWPTQRFWFLRRDTAPLDAPPKQEWFQ